MDKSAPAHFKPKRHYLIRPSLSNQAGGGMQAMLRRAKAFAQHYAMPIDLLTYTFQPGMAEVEESLRESGRLHPQVRIANMWNILSDAVSTPSGELFPDWEHNERLDQYQSGSEEVAVMDSGLKRVKRFRLGTGVLQTVDYLRQDGTRFVSDVKKVGPKSRRAIALLGPNQQTLKTWQSIPDMFAWVLTQVLGREDSAIIVDSPIIANSIAKLGYISPNGVLIKCFHSNHAASVKGVGFGVLSDRHVESLERADVFDANVFPSQGLATAAAELIGDATNFWTIGNIVDPAEGQPEEEEHRSNLGVVVSRLVKEKNIDHAIKAIQKANERKTRDEATNLSILGTGSDLNRLQDIVVDLGINDEVTFSGYKVNVYDEFKRASFSILPTRQEAFGLSIVESMACGCIPIVYDVPYGPSSIITQGVDGYLVPYGDVQGLADRVEQLRTMGNAELHEMRTAARRRAAEFAGPHIAEQWAGAIDAIWQHKVEHNAVGLSARELKLVEACGASSSTVEHGHNESVVSIRFTSDIRLRKRDLTGIQTFMSFRGRDSNLRLRTRGTVRLDGGGLFRRTSEIVARYRIPAELLALVPAQIIDIFVRINNGNSVREYRVPASNIEMADIHLPRGLEAYRTRPGNFSLRTVDGETNQNASVR